MNPILENLLTLKVGFEVIGTVAGIVVVLLLMIFKR